MPHLICADHGKRTVVSPKTATHRSNGEVCNSDAFLKFAGEECVLRWELQLLAFDERQAQARKRDFLIRDRRDEVTPEERLLVAIFGGW